MYLPSRHDIPADAYEPNDDALAEQAHELYWRGFQQQMASIAQRETWPVVLKRVSVVMRRGAMARHDEFIIQDFAETEGWPNTLRALARALEQQAVLDQANADPRR